jgi:4-hydroxybenzoate polyprenyltransferase
MPAAPEKASQSRVRVWLQLLRAPNLFTVPGDSVAGYLVSNDGFTDWSLPLVALASLCFYGAGLLLNDLVDLREDQIERPFRPLPSGLARPATVRRVLWTLNGAGLILLCATGSLRALACGALTVGAVCLYNCVTKHRPVWGALTMGACRGLSMLTGALAGPSPHAVLIAALIAFSVTLYIAAVTHLARFETRTRVPVSARVFPVLALLPAVIVGFENALYSPDKAPAALLFGLTLSAGLLLCVRLFTKPVPLPPLIGAHIRVLLPLQAATCWFGASQSIGPACAAALLCLWPVSKVVSKRFYAS